MKQQKRKLAALLLAFLIAIPWAAQAAASVLDQDYLIGYDPVTKVYTFQPGDMDVTAHYDDGTSKELAWGDFTLDKPFVQNNGDLSEIVTVSYTENGVTATDKFTVGIDLPVGQRGSVILDCNGGMIVPDDNWIVNGESGAVAKLAKYMIPYGTKITLPANKPERDGYEFVNWLDPETGDVYDPSDSWDMTGINELTLAAQWQEVSKYMVKYAVRLYGILEDVDENGVPLGLTFGPSGGYDRQNGIANQPLIHTYVCHDENDPMCLHNMTWEQIIEQSKTDPTVFQTCLENGCTHSVELAIPNVQSALSSLQSNQQPRFSLFETGIIPTLLVNDYNGQMDDGDGASALYGCIATNYRKWNPAYEEEDYHANIYGGWSDSMIRNTLNGVKTDNSGTEYAVQNENTCLLSYFPTVLRDNIVEKTVISGTGASRKTQTATTYDKLWLFSSYEMYKYGGYQYNTEYIDTREGVPYSSQYIMGAIGAQPNSMQTAVNRFYDESGDARTLWARSAYGGWYGLRAIAFDSDGCPGYTRPDTTYCSISPGFCLPGPNKIISHIQLDNLDPDGNSIRATLTLINTTNKAITNIALDFTSTNIYILNPNNRNYSILYHMPQQYIPWITDPNGDLVPSPTPPYYNSSLSWPSVQTINTQTTYTFAPDITSALNPRRYLTFTLFFDGIYEPDQNSSITYNYYYTTPQ